MLVDRVYWREVWTRDEPRHARTGAIGPPGSCTKTVFILAIPSSVGSMARGCTVYEGLRSPLPPGHNGGLCGRDKFSELVIEYFELRFGITVGVGVAHTPADVTGDVTMGSAPAPAEATGASESLSKRGEVTSSDFGSSMSAAIMREAEANGRDAIVRISRRRRCLD